MKKLFSKKTISAFLALIMTATAMLGMLTFSASAETAIDWDADEITLYTADDVLSFVAKLNGGETFSGKTLKLANDIELNSNWTATDKNNKPDKIWTISVATGFAGTFDGNHHVLSGIYADITANGGGLLGCVKADTTAIIKNLKITNSFIHGQKYRMGGFFGDVSGTANFENVWFDAILVSDVALDACGGFIAYMWSGSSANINNCIMSGTVSGLKSTGGFVAGQQNGADTMNIRNCAMYGTVLSSNIDTASCVYDDNRGTCVMENIIVVGTATTNTGGNVNYVIRNNSNANATTTSNILVVKEEGKNITTASQKVSTIITASDITGIAAQAILDTHGMTGFVATTTGYPMPKTLVKAQTPTADKNALTNYVGYQTTKVTDGKFGLRLVANLDAHANLADYENVGFKVVAFFADGTKVMTNNCVQTKVYESITTTTADGNASFAQQGKYIFVQECLNITTANGDITFEVTTYATDSEGNETLGATYRFVVDVSEIPSAS